MEGIYKMTNGKKIVKTKEGKDLVTYDTDREYTKEELKQQREDFAKEAKDGQLIDLTALFINHGL